MSLAILLDMAASANPDRAAVVSGETRWTTAELNRLADGGGGVVAESGAGSVAYIGTGGALLPLLIFAAARANRPLTPLNYRLSPGAVRELIARLPDPLVIYDEEFADVAETSGRAMGAKAFVDAATTADPAAEFADPDDVAIVLFTSGTTNKPKAVELSHHNLTSYITGTVEFDSADAQDAALICVPPYHIAGVSAALSNLYAGRKMVYLNKFEAAEWLRLANAESVTSGTVVPTMLDRIVAELVRGAPAPSSLRNLAYGGSKVPLPLVRRALDLLPDVGFVNAYGLTETSSTIAVLTPEDHRDAHGSPDPDVKRRLGSVGRPVPGIEVEIRAEDGKPLGHGEIGELFIRGEQVSGKYTGIGSVLDENGWFPTRDLAWLDAEGFLFINGRSDDTIIRGGENIAPAELEDVLVEHPQVCDVAVVGVPDPEWGQIMVAVVVPEADTSPDPEELREYVRAALRGSRTPDRVVFRDQLPTSPTGKVLRRELAGELSVAAGTA